MSIGKFVRDQVLLNPEAKNDDILKLVKAKFPEAKTSYACIAWYKSDMRKKGIIASKKSRTLEQVQDELLQAMALVEKLEAEVKTFEVEVEEEPQE
jgi:hypothetical protein